MNHECNVYVRSVLKSQRKVSCLRKVTTWLLLCRSSSKTRRRKGSGSDDVTRTSGIQRIYNHDNGRRSWSSTYGMHCKKQLKTDKNIITLPTGAPLQLQFSSVVWWSRNSIQEEKINTYFFLLLPFSWRVLNRLNFPVWNPQPLNWFNSYDWNSITNDEDWRSLL